MSYLSDFKRTKSKTLGTAKQTEDEVNKSAVWSSANNTNRRLTFLKFDYRKYSNFLLLYKSTCHLRLKWTQGKTSSHWYLQLHTRLAERYRWRCADLHIIRQARYCGPFCVKLAGTILRHIFCDTDIEILANLVPIETENIREHIHIEIYWFSFYIFLS